jgi:hypothetical protein
LTAKIKKVSTLSAILFSLAFAGCASISDYDQTAYKNAVDLKVDTLTVMSRATQPYSSQKDSLDALEVQMEKAYEYDAGRPLNQKTLKMWGILLKTDPANPEDGIWPKFVEKWRVDGRLSGAYLLNKKENVADAFNKIIQLESGKLKPSDIP